MPDFRDVQVGDTVLRLISSERIPMKLKVTHVDDTLIYCGFANKEDCWTFDRETGVEIDERFGWGPKQGISGS